MKILLLNLLIYTLFQTIGSRNFDPKRVVWAVDSGAMVQLKSNQGFFYQNDQGYSESQVSDYSTNPSFSYMRILYTYDDFLYKTERHHYDSFSYEIPVTEPGTYVLILKFVEMYFNDPGQRVFNIKFGDKTLIKGLDIVQKVGRFAAYDEYIEFELKNDQIYFKNTICQNAYKFTHKRLLVEFEKTNRDNPKVDGYVLYKGKLEDTDYNEIDQFRAEWLAKLEEEKKKSDEEKKKKVDERKKREPFDRDILNLESSESLFTSIYQILTGQEGLIIFGLVTSYIILVHLFGNENIVETNENKKKKK